MNSNATSLDRRVRFDMSSKMGDENKTQRLVKNMEVKDDAIVISKRILDLSRQRRKNQRLILLEVAESQAKAVNTSSKITYEKDTHDFLQRHRKCFFPTEYVDAPLSF